MLPAAHAAKLRVVAGARGDLLHKHVEEFRLHRWRQSQQDQQLRLLVARRVADEPAEWAVIRQQRHLGAVLGRARFGTVTEAGAQPPFQNALEVPERSGEIRNAR